MWFKKANGERDIWVGAKGLRVGWEGEYSMNENDIFSVPNSSLIVGLENGNKTLGRVPKDMSFISSPTIKFLDY